MSTALDQVRQVPAYIPPTIRSQHCGVEDWFRYVGAMITGIGIAFTFYQKWTAGGVFLVIAEVTILGSHVLEKTCGNWRRAARAAERIVGAQQKLLAAEDQAVRGLQRVVQEKKNDGETFEGEQEALMESAKQLAERSGEIQLEVRRYQEENKRLQDTQGEFQATISSQQQMIAAMQAELGAFTEQNNLLQTELSKIKGLATTLEATDQRIATQAGSTSTALQQGLAAFAANVKEMREITVFIQSMAGQNQQLHNQVGQLTSQVQAFEEARNTLEQKLQATTAIYQSTTATCTGLSGIAGKIEGTQQAIKQSEETITAALSRLETLATGQHARNISRTDALLAGASS